MMETNRKGKSILLLAGIVICGVLFILWGVHMGNPKERYVVSVITGGISSDRWAVLQQGVEQAGIDYDVQVNFYSAADTDDAQEQVNLILRELDKQVDALIIDAIDSEAVMKVLQEEVFDEDIILIETDLKPEQIYINISADNYQMGYDLGTEMLKQNGQRTVQVGVIADNIKTVAVAERLQGLQDALEKQNGIKINWIETGDAERKEDKASMVGIIAALDCTSTEWATKMMADKEIYGFGNIESNIYYLDRDLIKALVVPNEYNMGYLSVKAAIGAKEKAVLQYDDAVIEHIVVTKDTLYEEQNQRIVFPFVQ